MDPAATDTLEYLHGGDTAIVAAQYSYLTSPLSLLVEPGLRQPSRGGRCSGRSTATGRRCRRSAGRGSTSTASASAPSARSSRSGCTRCWPIRSTARSGPGRRSRARTGASATDERNPGSPAWLPRFGDGSVIRFTNQENALDIPGATWGPLRIVYLQYASDPIIFFSPSPLYRKPDWMKRAGRAGRLAGAALVPGGDLPAAPARHGDRAGGADRARAPLRPGALHRRLAGGDRAGGLDAARRSSG